MITIATSCQQDIPGVSFPDTAECYNKDKQSGIML